MKQRWTKLVGMLLAIAMLVGMMPVGIYAAAGSATPVNELLPVNVNGDISLFGEDFIDRESVAVEQYSEIKVYPEVGDKISSIDYGKLYGSGIYANFYIGSDAKGPYIKVSAQKAGVVAQGFDITLKNGGTIYYELTANVYAPGKLLDTFSIDLRSGQAVTDWENSTVILQTLENAIADGKIQKQRYEALAEIRYDIDKNGKYDIKATFTNGIYSPMCLVWSVLDSCNLKGDFTVALKNAPVSDYTYAMKALFRFNENYGLKVAGVEVTSVNKDNILDDENCSFIYLSDKKMLAIDCKSFELNGQFNMPLIESHVDGLTIYSDLRTELRNVNNVVMALYGDTVIDGADISVYSENSTPICVYDNVTLNLKANVYAEGNKHALLGRDKNEKLIISGKSLKARANTEDEGYGAIEDFRGGIELYNCYLTYPSDAEFYVGDAVVNKRRNLCHYVEVEPAFNGKIKVGDVLLMGTYNNERIMWRCVATDSNGPLILAEDILCLKAFDAKTSTAKPNYSHDRDPDGGRALYGSNYWGTSNLRYWLNSEAAAGEVDWKCGSAPSADYVKDGRNAYDGEAGFLTNFNDAEKAVLKSVSQRAIVSYPEYNNISVLGEEPHQTNDTPSVAFSFDGAVGNYNKAYYLNAEDKMFILDVNQLNEVFKNDELLDNEYFFMGHLSEEVGETIYDDENNDYISDGFYPYWLRTPVASSDSVVRALYGDGRTVSDNTEHGRAYDGLIGVRPAFYLDETKSVLVGKGNYESPFTVHGTDEVLTPTPTPKPTPTPAPGTTPVPATAPPFVTPSPEPTEAPAQVSKVDVGTGIIKIKMGQSYDLKFNVLPSNAEYSDLFWQVGDADIATVSKTAYTDEIRIKAHNPGRTKVTVVVETGDGGRVTGTRWVDVLPSDNFVNVSGASLALADRSGNTYNDAYAGATHLHLAAAVEPSNAKYKKIEYSSSNTAVAEIDSLGRVKFNAPGYVTLYADIILYPVDIEERGDYYCHIPLQLTVRVLNNAGYNKTFGYRFMNTKNHFGYSSDYKIPYWVYNAAGMTDFEAFFHRKVWGGSCVGMSASSMMFYLGKLDASKYQEGAVVPYDLGEVSPNNSSYNTIADPKYNTILRMIEIAHVAQYNHYDKHYITRYSGSKDYEGDDLRTMAECVKAGTPVMLSLRTSRCYGCLEGHTVLLTSYQWDEARNEHVFYIYDPSEFVTSIRFGKKKNGYYKFGLSYISNEYTWYPEAYYTTTSVFDGFKYLKKHNKEYFLSAMEDEVMQIICPVGKYTFTDSEGNTVVIDPDTMKANMDPDIIDGVYYDDESEDTAEVKYAIEGFEIEQSEYLAENPYYTITLPVGEYDVTGDGVDEIEIMFGNENNIATTNMTADKTIHITPDLHDITASGNGEFRYDIKFTEFNNEKVFDEMQLTGTATGTVEAILEDDDATVKGANNLSADIKVSGCSTYLDAPSISGDEIQVRISDENKACIIENGEIKDGIEQEISIRMQTQAPEYTLYPGEYYSPQELKFNYYDDETVIYYTTDGSYPTHNSYVYTGPIAVNKSMKIRAIAAKYGYDDSIDVMLDYDFPYVEAPSTDTSGGLYKDAVTVELSGDSKILFTTDDSDPAESGIEYTSKLNITENTVLRAVCVNDSGVVSEELREVFFISSDYKFDTSAILVDESGEAVDDLSGAKEIIANLRKSDDSEVDARIFAAFYDSDGKCIEVRSVTDTFTQKSSSVNIPVPENDDICNVKIFCWDSNLKPLAKNTEF